jgi:hypothetical protein
VNRSQIGVPSDQSVVSWRKSTYSNPSGNCVEMARVDGVGVALRNSRDPLGPVLTWTPAEMTAFVHGIKAGEFDDLIAEDVPPR